MGDSGSLGRLGIVPIADVETGTQRLSVSQDIKQKFQANGFSFGTPPSDGFRGDIPNDITSLDHDELGDLLAHLASYLKWVSECVTGADVDRKEADAQHEFIKAKVRMNLRGSGERLTGPDKNDMVTVDERVVEAQRRLLYCEGYYSMVRVIRDNVEKNWDTVSRRISQVIAEKDRSSREQNVGNIPVTSQFRRPGRL